MKISLTKAGKRYNRTWIFRNLTVHFESGQAYALTGPNGSGKSTLLQAIGGYLTLSEGSVDYSAHGTGDAAGPAEPLAEKALDGSSVHHLIAMAAPYLELIEEFSLREFLEFHRQFKPFLKGIDPSDIIQKLGLSRAADQQIRYFSSGMKQRVRLAQAIFSEVPAVLLDEPCTNLDAEGIALYQQMMAEFGGNRLIMISSNDPAEYGFCRQVLYLPDYQ